MRLILSAILIISASSIYAQKKKIALTPPMGWNTWNTFHCDVNEELIKGAADAMVSSGMKDAGYEYVVIDDCWQISRDSTGKIVADPEHFPSGIKALADYVHSKGLKFGLYSDVGRMTCQRRPGSRGYEEIDAKTYEEWGVDYLKYDWCYHGNLDATTAYETMGNALAALDREIVYSICNWGVKKPWLWAGKTGHLWRTTGDIIPKFSGASLPFFQTVVDIIEKQADLHPYAKPGAWNDPDMMEVGHGLTQSENRAHMTMWCMMAAPLMAGNDIRELTPDVTKVLTNKEVIAIDQDPLGKQGQRIWNKGGFQIWVKELKDGEKAICFFNRSKKEWNLKPDWASYGVDGSAQLRDLWKHEDIGNAGAVSNITVPSHDVVVFRMR